MIIRFILPSFLDWKNSTLGWLTKNDEMATSKKPVSLSTLAAKNTICCIYQLLLKERDGREAEIQVLLDLK